jgi:hypothetical protein
MEKDNYVGFGIQRMLVSGSMLNVRASSLYGRPQPKEYPLPPGLLVGKPSTAVPELKAKSWNDVDMGEGLLDVDEEEAASTIELDEGAVEEVGEGTERQLAEFVTVTVIELLWKEAKYPFRCSR